MCGEKRREKKGLLEWTLMGVIERMKGRDGARRRGKGRGDGEEFEGVIEGEVR